MAASAPQPPRPGKPGGAPKPKPALHPARKATRAPAPKPGDGFLGWLGRQVGHVKKAVHTDVTKPAATKAPKPKQAGGQAAPRSPRPQAQGRPVAGEPAGSAGAPPSKVIYRNDKIEEAELPDRPGVKLRRTIVDEVIVEDPTPPIEPNQGGTR